jgi:hypothetical protein
MSRIFTQLRYERESYDGLLTKVHMLDTHKAYYLSGLMSDKSVVNSHELLMSMVKVNRA